MEEGVDVIVVGAGPAGSSAAYFLAQAGVQVLLLDKEIFPRNKTCGDSITHRALRQLARMGLDRWLEAEGFHAPTGVRIGAPNGELAVLEIPSHSNQDSRFGRIIPRRKLDAALVDAATAAGARFMAGARATGMSVDDGGANVHVIANDKPKTLHCQIAIAADGTKGSFSRSIGLQDGPLLGVAVRAYLAGSDRYEDFVDWHYEFDTLPGYGWVFPCGDGLCNVGIGFLVGQVKKINPAGRLQEFISTNPYVLDRLPRYEIVEKARGASLYGDFRPKCTYRDRLLAVGDAVGLINPLTGAGISKALISGEIAAQCAHDALVVGDCSAGGLALYGERLRARFGKRHSQLRVLQCLFRRRRTLNNIIYLLNHDEPAKRLAESILGGKADYVALLRPGALVKLLFGRYGK